LKPTIEGFLKEDSKSQAPLAGLAQTVDEKLIINFNPFVTELIE